MIKLLIAGAAGRMGSRIDQIAQGRPNDFQVIYKLDLKQPSTLSSIPTFGMDSDKIAEVDVVIDFTVPEATLKTAEKVAKYKKSIVIGTTGFSPLQEKQL
jgi:4-hydroxy-tetrahydrodipicolinate reductase